MIKILIADDHPVVRKGLKDILTTEIYGVQCGEAKNAQGSLDELERESWDLAILDISMPGRSGLDVLKELKQRWPKLPVLVLSVHSEAQFGARALRAGASGYLTKESVPDELVQAVRRVLAGRTYVSQAMAESLAVHFKQGSDQPPHEKLSDREFEILRMIGSGKSNAEIARELHLSATTISTYRVRILKKLDIKTTAGLIRYAVSNNLTA